MSQYITTHNEDGKAVFSSKISTERHKLSLPNGVEGYSQILYSNESFKPDLSSDADIDHFAHIRENGHAPGTIGPANGVATAIVAFGPGHESPWHRTMTLDTIVVLEGVVELYLDGGETKTLKAGDTAVQRATMHKWKNVTPENGWVRLLGIAQPIQEPLKAGGKELSTEWKF